MVNQHPARAFLDSGLLGNFISTTLVDQLQLTWRTLDTPLALQLAVQGLRSKVNASASAQLKYQGIDEQCTFDIINLNSYDLILSTPWMYQHQVCLGFNPPHIIIGSDEARPLIDSVDTKLMISAITPEEQAMEDAQIELQWYAEPLCKEVDKTKLPPFCVIHHTIPLIDKAKIYISLASIEVPGSLSNAVG